MRNCLRSWNGQRCVREKNIRAAAWLPGVGVGIHTTRCRFRIFLKSFTIYFGKWSNFSLRCFFRTGLKVQTVFDVSNNVNVAHGVRNCSTILRSACSSFTISHANTYYAFAPVTGTVSVPTFSHLLIPSSQSKHGGWRRLTFFLVTSIH